MSAGTKVYTVRLPMELVKEVEETVNRRNYNSDDEPWTFSDFIRISLEREMRHMARSRKPRKRKDSDVYAEPYQG